MNATSSSVIAPRGAELPNDETHMDGVPHQDGVAQEAQTTRLVHNLIVPGLKRPLISEKEAARQLMPKLTPVELALGLGRRATGTGLRAGGCPRRAAVAPAHPPDGAAEPSAAET
jgi:hypothetical protein